MELFNNKRSKQFGHHQFFSLDMYISDLSELSTALGFRLGLFMALLPNTQKKYVWNEKQTAWESLNRENEIQVSLQLINIFWTIHPANVYAIIHEIHENFCSNVIRSVIKKLISSVPIVLIFFGNCFLTLHIQSRITVTVDCLWVEVFCRWITSNNWLET